MAQAHARQSQVPLSGAVSRIRCASNISTPLPDDGTATPRLVRLPTNNLISSAFRGLNLIHQGASVPVSGPRCISATSPSHFAFICGSAASRPKKEGGGGPWESTALMCGSVWNTVPCSRRKRVTGATNIRKLGLRYFLKARGLLCQQSLVPNTVGILAQHIGLVNPFRAEK